jgi:hypothetical protein
VTLIADLSIILKSCRGRKRKEEEGRGRKRQPDRVAIKIYLFFIERRGSYKVVKRQDNALL